VTMSNSKEITFRSTFVLHLENGVWKIVHVHNSNPVSNMAALGYESRGFEALLDAAQSGEADIGQTGIASVMFTDIADSTTLAETLGDAAWSRVVAVHLDSVQKAVEAAGGTLVKSLGDGTMSSFSSAGSALRAAQTIQRENASVETEPRLRLRVGIHTGDVVEAGGDFVGTVVNKAARIASAARPGEIRVSEATRIMVGGASGFTFSDAATIPLRGLEGEHLIYRLDWRS
jgi:adenylate cyclase